MEQLRRLAKDMRREAAAISIKELSKLDCSDRILMARRLELGLRPKR